MSKSRIELLETAVDDLCLRLVAEQMARQAGDHALREVLMMATKEATVNEQWERRKRWWKERFVLGLGDSHPGQSEAISEMTGIGNYSDEDEIQDQSLGYPTKMH